MALSTSYLRTIWSPACRGKGSLYHEAYRALDLWLKYYGYRPRYQDTGAYNCRKITGGSGYSLHAYGPGSSFTFWTGVRIATSLAVDINWQLNPYGPRLITNMPRAMVTAILGVRTNNGKQVWGWGGYYRGNKDAMHYEIVCSPADLRTGIRISTLPGGSAAGGGIIAPVDPEEFDLSKAQYDNIMGKLGQIQHETSTREERTLEILHKVEKVVLGLTASIYSARDSIVDLQRRIWGIPEGDNQHDTDRYYGRAALVRTVRSTSKNIANASRRLEGVQIVADNAKQHALDAAHGSRVARFFSKQ